MALVSAPVSGLVSGLVSGPSGLVANTNASVKWGALPSHSPAQQLALWQAIQAQLLAQIGQPALETWIRPLQWVSFGLSEIVESAKGADKLGLVLAAPSQFARSYVLAQYQQALLEAAQTVVGQAVSLRVIVQAPLLEGAAGALPAQARALSSNPQGGVGELAQEPVIKPAIKPISSVTPLPAAGFSGGFTAGLTGGVQAVPQSGASPLGSPLNPHYDWARWVVGANNRFATATLQATAQTLLGVEPSNVLPKALLGHPLMVVHSPTGLGKTHLLQAFTAQLKQHLPPDTARWVCYSTAEQWTNEWIEAVAQKKVAAFRQRYRQLKVWVLDDVAFVEGKERTQQELLHTLNTLLQKGAQVVLGSSRPPEQLNRLHETLKNRLCGGLSLPLTSPSLQARQALVQAKGILLEETCLPQPVIDELAQRYSGSIRLLEGALHQVVAYARFSALPVSLPLLEEVLGAPPVPVLSHNQTHLEGLLEQVARQYGLSAADLKSPLRSREISYARQVAVYALRQLTGASFAQLGRLLGGRKHTTLLYAYNCVVTLAEKNPNQASQLQSLLAQLKAARA